MLAQARILEARARMDETDIAAVTICTADYHRQTFERFQKREMIARGRGTPPESDGIKADPEEQANAMRALFGLRPGMGMNGGR